MWILFGFLHGVCSDYIPYTAADNKVYAMWNQTVDRAMVSGVMEVQIMEVKSKEI